MPSKIFISYRREDTAATALSIGQYLEHHLGRKNVFIDVDMHAGARFPAVLEQRLGECKVLLALIGPGWLNARDERGNRRLDNSDDWVRLEIARALGRNITVIPVRVNGAELPPRSSLPEDIRGLLDHQAVSITITGFRHEMASLVRDIRSIPDPRNRRLGAMAAALATTLAALAVLAYVYSFPTAIQGTLLRLFPHSAETSSASERKIWKDDSARWVMYALDNNPIAYFFDPTSVKMSGEYATYTARFPLKAAAANSNTLLGVYEDDVTTVDCTKSVSLSDERTIYDKSGGILYHYKRPEQTSFDQSNANAIPPGSILSIGKNLVCTELLRQRSLSTEQLTKMSFSYLTGTPTGDGDIYFLQNKSSSDTPHRGNAIFIVKLHNDREMAGLFSKSSVLGLPGAYRTLAEPLQFDCDNRTVQLTKDDYFDRDNNWIRVTLPTESELQPINVQPGSNFDVMLNAACVTPSNNVSGHYDGTNYVTYKSGGQAEQKISIVVEQTGSKVSVTFQTASGGQGQGIGKLSGTTADSVSLKSTAPGCEGSYAASFNFIGGDVSWSFTGQDCGGAMEGHGTARRANT